MRQFQIPSLKSRDSGIPPVRDSKLADASEMYLNFEFEIFNLEPENRCLSGAEGSGSQVKDRASSQV